MTDNIIKRASFPSPLTLQGLSVFWNEAEVHMRVTKTSHSGSFFKQASIKTYLFKFGLDAIDYKSGYPLSVVLFWSLMIKKQPKRKRDKNFFASSYYLTSAEHFVLSTPNYKASFSLKLLQQWVYVWNKTKCFRLFLIYEKS